MLSEITRAIELLNDSEVIAIPTETVYRFAGYVYNEKANSNVFKLKNRLSFNPLIVHIKSLAYLEKVAIDIPDAAMKLSGTFFPATLTLV